MSKCQIFIFFTSDVSTVVIPEVSFLWSMSFAMLTAVHMHEIDSEDLQFLQLLWIAPSLAMTLLSMVLSLYYSRQRISLSRILFSERTVVRVEQPEIPPPYIDIKADDILEMERKDGTKGLVTLHSTVQ